MESDDDLPALIEAFDEARDATGTPRAGYGPLLEALAGTDLEALSAGVNAHVADGGADFGGEPFVVDPVPRIILGSEWDELAAGLAQRTRALNRFLLDAYSEQRVVAAGIVAAGDLEGGEGFEPDLVGRLPAHGSPAAVIGFDVVRDPSGAFVVLEDNVRTPSGYSYALAARRALGEALPGATFTPRAIDPATHERLGEAIRAAAPDGAGDPTIAVLTDGPGNVAYTEHAQAAERIGALLVTLAQLIADGDRLRVRLESGREVAVDVIYRRSNEDRVRDERGELTPVAAILLPAWLAGNLGLVNAFGNGIADDKLIHGHVEDFVRFYLGEEPLVRSVPTLEVSGDYSVRRLRELVVKPRHGHGGAGVVIGAHARDEDLVRLSGELARDPERYISQPTIALSTHPTVIDGRLEPRHVDLRAFAFSGTEVTLMPGGLSRYAQGANALVVNSSQNGGGKDTWVVDL
jgi:uncharacterized circularly permuted ATP-grasp superfamily protein